MIKNKIQIGVIGSHSKKINLKLINIAKKVGKEIASNNIVLLFSIEGDGLSLPEIAAISANNNKGVTVGFLWSKNRKNIKTKSIKIFTGQLRGGGREFSFINSCNSIISIGGGSGTLMEMAMAYQQNIPVIAIKNTGGWSQKLSNKFIDNRNTIKIFSADDPKKAVDLAIRLSTKYDKL